MNKHLLTAVMATTVLAAGSMAVTASAAMAEDGAVKEKMREGMEHGEKHMKRERPKNRAEAIEKTKERLNKLESMSDEEWEEYRKEGKARWEERKARKEKMRDMSPEDREALKKKFKEMHDKE